MMTPKQQKRQKHRTDGKYAKVNPCYVCGESAGEDYCSHPDTDGLIADELLVLCDRCAVQLEDLSGPDAVKQAEVIRAAKKECSKLKRLSTVKANQLWQND